ncbi:unnamed protein product [Gadus morhua 'NCC']
MRILKQDQNGCNTSDLQSEAELEHEVELPDKRNRKPVHRQALLREQQTKVQKEELQLPLNHLYHWA